MHFICVTMSHGKKDSWQGFIDHIHNYGSHYEILIKSRSSILVILGKTCYGYFACMPDFNAGCHLGSPDNTSYNTDKLSYAMKNKIDGATVAMALKTIANKLI